MGFKTGDQWNGNKQGRTPGTGHRQQAFNAFVIPHKEALFAKAIEMALAGNERLLVVFLERLMPAKPIDEPVHLDLPNQMTFEATSDMGKEILQMLANEKITPTQAKALFGVVQFFQENIAAQDLLALCKNLSDSVKEIQSTRGIIHG